MANLNISSGIGNNGGIVTSTDTSQLNIVTQSGAAGWNAPNTPAQAVRDINRITVHYTGWPTDGPQTATLSQYNNWWGDHSRSSGYHFIIQANGTVWQTTRISKVAYGSCANTRTRNIHIALVGLLWDGVSSGRPRRNDGTSISGVHHMSTQQQTALQRLIQGFISNTGLPLIDGIERVFGHQHLPNPTDCPGYTLNNLRSRITPALQGSSITQQPSSRTRIVGQTATFTVTASGNPRSYQWQWLNTTTGRWQNVQAIGGASGMNTRTLTQANVQMSMNGWTYRVLVGNASGFVTSNSVRLTVVPGTFTVRRGNTFVGTSPNSGHLATINAGGTFTRNSGIQIVGGWTWMRGRLSGQNVPAHVQNRDVWVSVSQLERASGVECPITDPQNFGFTSVRHTPAGANAGTILGNTTRFRPTGDPRVSASGFNWRLGTIMNTASQFHGATMWVATTQFPAGSPCR